MDNQKNMNKKTIVIVMFLVLVALAVNWIIQSQINQEAASIKSQDSSQINNAQNEKFPRCVPDFPPYFANSEGKCRDIKNNVVDLEK